MTLLLRSEVLAARESYVRGPGRETLDQAFPRLEATSPGRRAPRRLLHDRRAVGAVGPEGTPAHRGLLELVRLPEVVHRAGEVHAIVEAGAPEREPGVDAERPSVD